MIEIDLATWRRREHFNMFSRADLPHYNICADVDATAWKHYTKQQNLSFYYSMVWLSTYTANQIEEFRYRIRGSKVVLHEQVHPSFTDITKPDDLFKIVNVNMQADIRQFVKKCAEKSAQQTCYFPFSEMAGRDELIYLTCIPWVSFTMLSHTMSLNKDDSVPRISWGKYIEKNGCIMMPFSVQVHHALADGIHVGRYFELLQDLLNHPEIVGKQST